jgi:hypothetical protein
MRVCVCVCVSIGHHQLSLLYSNARSYEWSVQKAVWPESSAFLFTCKHFLMW